MKKTFKRIIATLSIIAIVFSLSAPTFAIESRNSTNGYTYTDVIYNSKSYTISLGIGSNSSYGVRAAAYCPIHGIYISIDGVSASFDTRYEGRINETGSPGSGTTDSSNSFYVYTPYVYCSNANNYIVERIYLASTSATFYSVNNGNNVTLSVKYSAN